MLEFNFFNLFSFNLEIIIRVILAILCGLIIGFERRAKQYGLGSRTSMLICLGACLFTITGISFFDETNLSRIAQGLAAGVGFIGAAIIWQQKQDHMWIYGLTSAASIWALTAIGFTIGAGHYFLGIIITIIVLVILLIKKIGFE